jgi:hypothetical protein
LWVCVVQTWWDRMTEIDLEECRCPYCDAEANDPWAIEKGFSTVRCRSCEFLFLSPRPSPSARTAATNTGTHKAAGDMDISERYVSAKVAIYRSILAEIFADVWGGGEPVSWVDIGSGYGEVMDAVRSLAPAGSTVMGIEPMEVKAQSAIKRGLNVQLGYAGPHSPKAQYASLINVFSHVYEFDALLKDISLVLLDKGELFLETGDMTDIHRRQDLPFELGSPDHVTFASETHIRGFLERNGFEIVSIKKKRVDGIVNTLKNILKKAIGRSVIIKFPYSSKYKTMFVRARKI